MGCGSSSPKGPHGPGLGLGPSSSKPSGGGAIPPKFGGAVEARKKLRVEDYMASNLTGVCILRKPGEVDGQAFMIDNCTDCNIFIFDHTEQVTMDRCKGCKLFLAACMSSFFIRDCSDCDIVVATQQFRARDCKNLNLLLYSQSRPVIEQSSKLSLGCFRHSFFNFFGLAAHFDAARLSPWDNKWSEVFDFSRGASQHWSFMPMSRQVTGLLPSIVSDASDLLVADPSSSVDTFVPFTVGMARRRPRGDETVFLCFLPNSEPAARSLVEQLQKAATNPPVMDAAGAGGAPTDESTPPAGAAAGTSAATTATNSGTPVVSSESKTSGEEGHERRSPSEGKPPIDVISLTSPAPAPTIDLDKPLLIRSRVYEPTKPQARDLFRSDRLLVASLDRAPHRRCIGLHLAGIGCVSAVDSAIAALPPGTVHVEKGDSAKSAIHTWFEAWEDEENKH